MFPSSGITSSFFSKFYVMDVILNRSPFPHLLEAVNNNSSPLHGVPKGVDNSGKNTGFKRCRGAMIAL
jgi:hypothetical protein